MSFDPAANRASSAHASSDGTPPAGRIAVLTAFAVATGWIPIPVVPDRVLLRIRGAIAQDTVSRHGLSLTADARAVLAQTGPEHPTFRKAAEVVTLEVLRRFIPVGFFTSAARGFEVYALGYLLDRYITRFRRIGVVRIHAEEARRVREGIDRAVRRSLSPTLRAGLTILPSGGDDLRDEFTRWVDAVLLTGAAVPEYLDRRLEAAFDEIAATSFAHE
jgi:hypothetical protein